jgi:uncharacterized protein with HEPN domain
MQFQHLGETANKLKANFPEENSLPYKKMIGFRNFIAHDYVGIELGDVYETIVQDLPPLKMKLEKLMLDSKNNRDFRFPPSLKQRHNPYLDFTDPREQQQPGFRY